MLRANQASELLTAKVNTACDVIAGNTFQVFFTSHYLCFRVQNEAGDYCFLF